MRNHTGQRPNVAQRRLKTAAMGMADIYRKRTGQFDVTELQQNIIHFVQSHVPSRSRFPFCVAGMIAEFLGAVKIEQNNCYCSVCAAAVVFVMPTFTGKLPHR